MPDDPNPDVIARADEMLAGLSALPDAIDAALSRLGPPAPAAAARPAAAAAAPTVSTAEARLAALNAFDPFQRDPTPAEWIHLSAREQAIVEEIRDAPPDRSLYDRIELANRWKHEAFNTVAQQKRAEALERTVTEHAQRQAAIAQDQVEARHDAAHLAREDLVTFGQEVANLNGSSVAEKALELGVFDSPEDKLAAVGFGPREQAALKGARGRLVEVDPGRVSGQGFVTGELRGKSVAYVPADQDVDAFSAQYGPDAAAIEAAAGTPAPDVQWTADDGEWAR